MKIIGLTGGIGSGKTTVAKMFEEKGIPVYNSDVEAKSLMNTNKEVKEKIIRLLGEESYANNELNRKYIAEQVFNNPKKINDLNKIVHPAVFEDFKKWTKLQTTSMIIKEAAILFESGSFQDCDQIISVIADEEIRIARTMKRDALTRNQVLERIDNQWKDEQRIEKSDFIIKNENGLDELQKQVDEIYNRLSI